MPRFARFAGLVVACGLVGLPSVPVAANEPVPTRLATWNSQVGRSTEAFRAGVAPLLDRSDLVGLQEVDTKAKESVLADMPGWRYYRVKPALQTPVLWRDDRFALVRARVAKISGERWIGNEHPTMKPLQKARSVTVVRLVERATGAQITVINAHLISGATRNGQPFRGRPRLFALYKDGLARLGSITATEQRWGQVFVMGDFNAGWVADNKFRRRNFPIRVFRRLGMRAMWATEVPRDGVGTRNDKLIDQIYGPRAATSAKVQGDIRQSDHRPAVATYAS